MGLIQVPQEVLQSMKTRERISFLVLGTWTIGGGEVEEREEEVPLGLPGI